MVLCEEHGGSFRSGSRRDVPVRPGAGEFFVDGASGRTAGRVRESRTLSLLVPETCRFDDGSPDPEPGPGQVATERACRIDL